MTAALKKYSDRGDALLAGVQRLARLLWGADPEACRALMDGSFFDPFLFLESDAAGGFRVPIDRLLRRIQTFTDTAALCTELEADYVRLFINSRDGIVAPLYESCYAEGPARLMGPAAERMKERLDAHNLSVGQHLQEPPDHIAVELEYLYFLLERGFRENRSTLIEEGRQFSSETLLPWATLFHQRLSGHDPEGFYSCFAALLCSLLQWVQVEM